MQRRPTLILAARPTSAALLIAVLALHVFAPAAGSAERTPVARWDFGAEEATQLTSHGGVHRDVPGPRPPEYPDFEPGNTAVRLDGRGARFTFEDAGAQSPFDFANKDAITLEAWVLVDDLKAGENVYVIGKGRTGAAGFAPDNQNWALRVCERRGRACVSFLFASRPVDSGAGVRPADERHWHRWTTADGFPPGPAWHHIAVSYRFGEPKSIRGWIDGRPHDGVWDAGGATTEPPVVDDDAIWIGSSRSGSPSNSFRGSLDAIAVHRELFDDSVMKTRFRRVGEPAVAANTPSSLPASKKPAAAPPQTAAAPAIMPDLGALPRGEIVATFHEAMPAHDRWLNVEETWPAETMRWRPEAFLLHRIPLRYDAWGIRETWKAPVLVRLAADVQLAPGKRRFVLRARGLSRLWIDGQLVAKTKPHTSSPNGEEPLTPPAAPPAPGLRAAEHRQQEVFAEATIDGAGVVRVVVETLVGGKAFRAHPGELCVAVETADRRSFELLRPAGAEGPVPQLIDADVEPILARHERALNEMDDRHRREAAASQSAFWDRRHDLARQWVKNHPAPPVPPGAAHPIDAFLNAKVEQALAEASKTPAAESQQFYRVVLPILRDECFRCHGDKQQGGLRLNSRAAALQAGDSGDPAIVPGDTTAGELLRRIRSADPDERMPPAAGGLKPEQIAALEAWIKAGAVWPAPPVAREDVAPSPPLSDAAFLRRVSLDTVGVPPSEDELRAFLADSAPDKRTRAIDRLLSDQRWADHWISYWQDVLAENPTLINQSLNTTGPFRWYLVDSLRDDKPFDRFVTELILLRGSPSEGGSAGFGIAADNDAPLAAKGQIVANAFLGIELQCARCHDSPYHSTLQRDLYALAAMFDRKPATPPKTSRVPAAFFESKVREPLIRATLKLGEPVAPVWPFAATTGAVDDASLAPLLASADDTRERLAALVTAPQNTRFAQVIVNRVWRRLIGAGFVEPPHDWEGHAASHPQLLEWLARDFVGNGYDLKHLARRILTSQAYQREATGKNLEAGADLRFFVAPERRRLTAEQIVDSLYVAAGQPMNLEEITFDPDGRRPSSSRLTLGSPRRAWMLANLANERDRPSLSLPRAQAVADILEAFGWSGARQSPRTDRETSPNLLQPGVLANSTASVWLTRAARDSGLAETAIAARSPESLVDSLFLRYLSRLPTAAERAPLVRVLADRFDERILPAEEIKPTPPLPPLPRVTWSNHQRPEATTVAMELQNRARLGPPADPRLRPAWRELFEDVVWSVANLREFVWMP